MADIINHPNAPQSSPEIFSFSDGSSITLYPPKHEVLTVKQAIYMLEDVKLQIMLMMRES